MSNLKHMTPAQLRKEIAYLSFRRGELMQQAKDLEAQAEELQKEAAERRRKQGDLGQRECWARIYLAKTE